MAAPYHELRYREFRELWNKALGLWSKAGAWYGLHGHIYMGCVAALHRMSEIREIIRESTSTSINPFEVGHPGGPLASAYYSVAKKSHKKRNLRKALWHLERGMEDKSSNQAGLYAIRGSIYREQHRYFKAVDDYRLTLDLKEKSNATPGQIGEALSELGFGYLFLGRWLKAVDYMERGVKLLEQMPPSGFLVRAKRKLAYAYRLTGRLSKARELRAETEQIALTLKTLDQM
jgi:tetratricopeptide (TPR) repeat protein